VPADPNTKQKLSPILGLPIDDEPLAAVAYAAPEPADNTPRPELTVIIPARNEEQNLPVCLASLLDQDGELFKLGLDWELFVIDDDSTDSTRSIATTAADQYPGMTVLEAPALDLRATQRAFTGKTNACWAGAQQATGRWLLFTDADTLHEPGDLVRALHEAKKHEAALLSYSPRQIVHGFWQRALMPLVFSELASAYPPNQVNDPAQRIAAANGQFLMVEREAYFAVGGHLAVGRSVLEDVDLACKIKHSKRGLRFRYAPDALNTRMYRGLSDMVEGWTKNLVLLFPHALGLAAWRLLDVALLLLPLLIFALPYLVLWQKVAILLLWARTLLRYSRRVARSNFGFVSCSLSIFALPLFIVLLVRSWMKHKLFHQVTWKGREYRRGR
jgi:glycosyltransferase involved in cell wall biosynthesis